MTKFAVVTPSYRSDWPLFTALHESVLRYTPQDVTHYVIVPGADVTLFSQAAGRRCVVIPEESLYPRGYRRAGVFDDLLHRVPGVSPSARVAAVSIRRPFRPVRGWMMQQLLKMEACRQIEAHALLIVDSDVLLVRPVDSSIVCPGGRTRLYRRPGAVDTRLPLHMQWHAVARELLGLPPASFPAPDYVSSFNIWDRRVLRALLARVEEVTGRRWTDAVAAQRTFSEWTIYGLFADQLMPHAVGEAMASPLCHSYWDAVPLTDESAAEFAAGIGPQDVAILIQSKSRTPLPVRQAVQRSVERALAVSSAGSAAPGSAAGQAGS